MLLPCFHCANTSQAGVYFSAITCKISRMLSKGKFQVFSSRLSVTLSCPLDLTLFPMDTQRCKMQLESCESFYFSPPSSLLSLCPPSMRRTLKIENNSMFHPVSYVLCTAQQLECVFSPVGYTTDDLQFMWQTGDPVQMDEIALPQFDIRQEDIDYGNCTKYYAGTGTAMLRQPIKDKSSLMCIIDDFEHLRGVQVFLLLQILFIFDISVDVIYYSI